MINKAQIEKRNFPSLTQSLQSAVSVLEIQPGRLLLVCCWVSFRIRAALSGQALDPMRRHIICSGDLTETGVEKPLQAWMPSAHVWSNVVSPASPHFLNQVPSRAQQLRVPTLLVPHLTHVFPLLSADRLVMVGTSRDGEMRVLAWTSKTRDTDTHAAPSRLCGWITSMPWMVVSNYLFQWRVTYHMIWHKTQSFNNLLLQAWMPSAHVWSYVVSPASPHFWNQVPPRAQQLCFPDIFTTPHFKHLLLLTILYELVVPGVSVCMRALTYNTRPGTDVATNKTISCCI